MGLLLYINGITEDYKPKNVIFSEDELVHLFSEYEYIKTHRVTSMVNTWCIYGDNPNFEENNKIASILLSENVNTSALFVHDSELNPSWNAIDNILYNNYSSFLASIKNTIGQIAINIVEEYEESAQFEQSSEVLPYLDTLGIDGSTNNKKVLFGFNPNLQTPEFYNNEQFHVFSKKIYNFLETNKPITEPFTIYTDKKAIIIVESAYIKDFLSTILEEFKRSEEYEKCNYISEMINEWSTETSGDNSNEQ